MKFNLYTLLVLLVLIASCQSHHTKQQSKLLNTHLSSEQQGQLDSILTRALDREALYTLLNNVKPMSTISSLSIPIGNDDSLQIANSIKIKNKVANIQSLISTLNYPDLKFVLYPLKKIRNQRKNLQLVVVRQSSLDSLLRANESFFNPLGLIPGSHPATVLSTIEYSEQYTRVRAYGYLYGYPDYAVDFFVDAMKEMKENANVLPRNFFHIPTYSAKEGAFVYAYPKDQNPGDLDSALYFRSLSLLEEYSHRRNEYLRPDSTLKATELLRDYFQSTSAVN